MRLNELRWGPPGCPRRHEHVCGNGECPVLVSEQLHLGDDPVTTTVVARIVDVFLICQEPFGLIVNPLRDLDVEVMSKVAYVMNVGSISSQGVFGTEYTFQMRCRRF